MKTTKKRLQELAAIRNPLNEQNSPDEIKSLVEGAVDESFKKITRTMGSTLSAQQMSEIYKTVTFRMGQLLESYATYTQHIQQSNNSDDSLKKIADAEEEINISLMKIKNETR